MLADPVLTVFAGVFGAMLGSFLNVCVYRLPRNESVIRPRSRCPSCGQPIAWYDNIPALSWLLLLGRCRACKARISVQYPLVEVAVGLVWFAGVAQLGMTVEALRAAVFVTLLLGIALTDAQHYVIPDVFSLGGAAVGVALSPFTQLGVWRSALGAALGYGMLAVVKVGGDYAYRRGWIGGASAARSEGPRGDSGGALPIPLVAAVSMVLGGAASAGFSYGATCGTVGTMSVVGAGLGGALLLGGVAILGVAAFERGELLVEKVADLYEEGEQVESMGTGDLRLMAMVGAFIGPLGVFATVFLGSVVGLVAFVPFALRGRNPPIPFGVFLALGGVAALLGAHGLVACYTNLLAGP